MILVTTKLLDFAGHSVSFANFSKRTTKDFNFLVAKAKLTHSYAIRETKDFGAIRTGGLESAKNSCVLGIRDDFFSKVQQTENSADLKLAETV